MVSYCNNTRHNRGTWVLHDALKTASVSSPCDPNDQDAYLKTVPRKPFCFLGFIFFNTPSSYSRQQKTEHLGSDTTPNTDNNRLKWHLNCCIIFGTGRRRTLETVYTEITLLDRPTEKKGHFNTRCRAATRFGSETANDLRRRHPLKNNSQGLGSTAASS